MTNEELEAAEGKLIEVSPDQHLVLQKLPDNATQTVGAWMKKEPFVAVLLGFRAYKYERCIHILHPEHGHVIFRDHCIRIKLAE